MDETGEVFSKDDHKRGGIFFSIKRSIEEIRIARSTSVGDVYLGRSRLSLVFCCFLYRFVSFTGLGGVLSCLHMLYVMEFVVTLWIF